MFSSRQLLLLVCSALLISNIRAEDEVEGENGKAEQQVEETAPVVGPSPDAQTAFYFVEPADSKEIPAGKVSTFLVGFANKGEKDFTIHAIEPSFRHPFDFRMSILNLTAARYEKVVAPKQEATFDYRFIANEAFIGRPLGLVVNVHYTDPVGGYFVSTVYNETITVQEDESNFNTETGFLFITLGGLALGGVFLLFQVLSKFTRKSPAVSKSSRYETGTNSDEIDYEWIPRSHLVSDKSPKLGSPKNRKVKKAQ